MQFHRGRLIDHVHLRVVDVEASKRFYQVVLRSLGRDLDGEGEGYFFADELFVDQMDSTPSKVHLAFQAPDEATVQRFHQAGLAAGGQDNGAPGKRHYHPGYYAAFLLDPDGNNIEAVFHGASERSSPSVVISTAEPPLG